jgi:hypothetical protein
MKYLQCGEGHEPIDNYGQIFKLSLFGVPMKIIRLIKMCLNEIYSKVCIENICLTHFLSKMFKTRDALSPLLVNIALEYTIIKVHENQVGLKLNGTHHMLIYADDVNLFGDNIDPIKKHRKFR